MKFSRIFLISLLICVLISSASAYFMIRFIVGSFKEPPVSGSFARGGSIITPYNTPTSEQEQNKSTALNSENSTAIAQLRAMEDGVTWIVSSSSKSVVSIIITKEVQTYKSDPFGFFYEPAGTVRRKVWGGTGFFVSKDGYILTNKHVVADPNAEYSIILSTGEQLKAKVLAYDPTTDLAVIQAFRDTTTPYTDAIPLNFVSSQSKIQIGSFVVAIGNALAEFQNTVTLGVVSGVGRQIEANGQWNGGSETLSGLIQTDTAINPGNSWGPLINLDGKVIGINTAISAGANGIGFAIPLSEKTVQWILQSVLKTGKIKRAFIGIKYGLVTPEVAKNNQLSIVSGAFVGEVVTNSPAEKSGITAGDIIIEADGKEISGTFALRDALAEKLPGETVILKVYRKSSAKVELVELTLGEG